MSWQRTVQRMFTKLSGTEWNWTLLFADHSYVKVSKLNKLCSTATTTDTKISPTSTSQTNIQLNSVPFSFVTICSELLLQFISKEFRRCFLNPWGELRLSPLLTFNSGPIVPAPDDKEYGGYGGMRIPPPTHTHTHITNSMANQLNPVRCLRRANHPS
jgi:hypothetical protein